MTNLTYHDHHPSHPCYYKLGGKPLSLKAIRDNVIQSGYHGYMGNDIFAIDKMPEPKRSQKLKAIRQQITVKINEDIQKYRQLRKELADERLRGIVLERTIYNDLNTGLMLKHNHLSNHFAHFHLLDNCIMMQMELF